MAEAGHGGQQRQGMGVRGPGSCAEGEVDGAQECLLGGEERQSDCETLLPGGVGTARGAPRAVGLVGDLCAEGGQVLLALGLVDLGQECGAFVRQRPAAPAQVPGGTPVGGRARGLREPPTTQQRRHLWRVDLVVFGRATLAGLQRAGMAQDNREACMGPQVREPVPGAQALDRHDEPLSRRGKGLQEGLRVGLHMARHQNLAALVEEAERHGAGMQVDAAGKWVRSGRKAQ